MKMVENWPIDISKLKDLFGESPELLIINPYAQVPFNEMEWGEWFATEESFSFLFEKDEMIIGHTAIRRYPAQEKNFLCYVYLAPEYRSKGLIYQMISMTHEWVREKISEPCIYLNVSTQNLKAFNAYQKFGYKEDLDQGDKLRMVYFF